TDVGLDPTRNPVPCTLVRLETAGGKPPKEPIEFVLCGRFRGHPLDVATTIRYQPTAAALLPPAPPAARVTVQTSDAVFARFTRDKGALAIVLDCSGSMRYPLGGQNWGQRNVETRYDSALKILEGVLGKEFLRNTTVSLWIYGQRLTTGNEPA